MPVDLPPDYDIPGGAFFTQALPGRTDGAGFAVQDGHGARLWSGYLARGGVTGLGYPISNRFEWDGQVAQAFSGGVLRWNPEAGEADLLALKELPFARPPEYASRPDYPPLAAAEAKKKPWSGWWWPAFGGVGATLYAPNGPLDRYDRFVRAIGEDRPSTRQWERDEIYFPGVPWAGHCNGWAAAALLEEEPTEVREAEGVSFSVADLKGLLSDYHFADAAAWATGDDGQLNPAEFHRILMSWLGKEGKGFVATFHLGGEEVWSYPVYRFETAWRPHPDWPGVWQVTTTLWMAESNVAPDYLGLKPYPGEGGKKLEYLVEGDPRNPTDGQWTGTSLAGRMARPGRIWYPDPGARNLEKQLVSPDLDRGVIDRILGKQGS